ncbi:unnamed protein product [Rotaria sp. Silwood2]|nr:unnamed protein product [Rotaria sp. Silwood2]CAF4557094.1 unnamed protein product [Rotaria sp. Silwood2]
MRRSQNVRCERLLSRTFSYESNRLIKGSKYTIRILAENKLGQSEPAEIIEAFIVKHLFDVPNAPRELKVLGATKSTVVQVNLLQLNIHPYDVPTKPEPIDINELTDTSCILSRKSSIRDNDSSIIEYRVEQCFKYNPLFTRMEIIALITECFHKIENLLTNGE